jgi:multicomponent Na+:H+ antiporter subunit D
VSPLSVILIPFLGAIGIALAHRSTRLRDGLGWAAAIAFFIGVVQQVQPVLAGEGREQPVWTILPGIEIAFRIEPLGLLFVLVASTLWLVATLYAQSYMKSLNYPHLARFFACYSIALGAAAGVAFSANLLTLFIFYEILTISTYPLVTHSGNESARRGGRIYLFYLLASSIGLLLPAMLWTYHATGTLEFASGGILSGHIDPFWIPVLAGLFMFGIGKAALMPMHKWLPAAMVAPAPVSALLHAVAVVKAGVFTVLKVAIYVFGIDLLAETGGGLWIAWVAAFTIVAASLVALTLTDLKARLAYSTVAQLSYVILGAMIASPVAIVGATMQLALHAVAKITLFFGAGAIQVAHNRKTIPELDGLGRVMPWTFGAFTIGVCSIIGLPLFGGMWAKWYLLLASLEAEQLILAGALIASSLLNILYLLAVPIRGFFAAPAEGVPTEGIHEAPLAQRVAMVICASACVGLFFHPDPLYNLARMVLP